MKKNILVLLSIVSLFISCSNFVDVDVEKSAGSKNAVFTVTGSLVSGYEDGASSRSAFPANDVNLSLYTTNFYYKSSPTATERTLCYTTTNDYFELKLPSLGTYYLEAESYLTSDGTKTVALKTTSSVELTLTEDNPSKNDVRMFLKIIVNTSGEGSIDLYMKSFDTSKVVTMEIYEDNEIISDGSFIFSNGNDSTVNWKADNVGAGPHTYTFKFYSDSSSTELVYQCTETITILPGKTTDTWVDNGNAEYFTEEGAGFSTVTVMKITKTCLDNFALTNFYVSPAVTTSGNGSYFEPVKTLKEAVEKCVDSSKNYTINIMGDIEVNSGFNVSKSITIQKAPEATYAKIQYSSTSNCLFSVSASNTLKISNIDIEGPDALSNQSGGAAIYNRGTLILNNVNLSKFNNVSSTNQGGCLYNAGNGIISITGGSITSCASGEGGAIYNAGDIEIKDCTISSCTAQRGGAIYNYSAAKITLSGNTSITRCTASSNGGNGGGIYLFSGAKVYMQDSASITSCNAPSSNGGGIYYSGTTCRVYMKDSAYLDSASDIMVWTNAYVVLTGNLTPPEAARGIAATITPKAYTYGTLVLSGTGTYVADNYTKFKVSYTETPNPWKIDENGKLYAKLSALSEKPSGITEFSIRDVDDLNKVMSSSWTTASGETYTLCDHLTVNSSTGCPLNFAAVFDGANYTVSGLKNTFVQNLSGTIKNLTLVGTSSTAGFATSVEDTGKIENCTNKVVVTFSSSTAAANIGGFTQSNHGTITGCTNSAKITYNSTKNDVYSVGGIAGTSTGTISNCINTGAIIGNSTVSGNWSCPGGGIVGDVSSNTAYIINCKNTGNISNFSVAGGIVGQTKGKVLNCYNRATSIIGVNDDDYVGGICGGSGDTTYKPKISNCYSTTSITSTNKKAAILGSSSGTVEYCYYLNYTGAVAQANTTDGDTVSSFEKTESGCTLSNGKKVSIPIEYGGTTDNHEDNEVRSLLLIVAFYDSNYSSWDRGSDGYPVFYSEKH